jgi:UDP-2,4-diacetamido-2,4,6-trideoxy-beta-L-altropyranose hydrolase
VGFVMRPGSHVEGFETVAAPGVEGDLSQLDLEVTVETTRAAGSDCVVVDHYGARAAYFEGIKAAGLKLAVIDDRADRDLRAADWVLNQNMAASTLEHRVGPQATLLLGLRYALLRPEFPAARAALDRRFSTEDRRVLVTLGGGETTDLCSSVLAALEEVEQELEVRCVVACPSEELGARARRSRHQVAILAGVGDMATQMAWCDVSVNAGGSTCWELLCLGVPMVVTALSSDQSRNPPALAEAGVAVALASPLEAAAAVAGLLDDPARRASMSQAGMTLVDGAGAGRAAGSLEQTLHGARVTVDASG